MAYLGLGPMRELVRAGDRLLEESERATSTGDLRAAGQRFGRVLGDSGMRVLLLMATAALGGKGSMVAKGPKLPGFGRAALPFLEEGRVDNGERVRHLTSDDTKEILDALRELKLDRETPPSDEVVEVGLELMKSPDAEVRYETVWALCLHWGHLRTLPMLRAMLEGQEKDVEVLIIAARSVGSMVERCGHSDAEAFRVLARVALDESADAELRGVAYVSLRSAAGLLPASEQALLPEDIRQLDVDEEWLRAIAGVKSMGA